MSENNKSESPEDFGDLKQKLKKEMKKKLKDELKAELKKELLEEIYRELKTEEDGLVDGAKPIVPANVSASSHKESVKSAPAPKVAKTNFKIDITIRAVLKFSSHALKYAHKGIPRDKWVEIIGLLAGTYDEKEDRLVIEDAYPMGHGDAIYAEIKDYKNYIRAWEDIRKRGYFIVGWYHSHPSYGLFMSGEDIGTQSRYQRLWKKSVALVVDPYMIDGSSFGFEIFRAKLKTQKWFTLPYSIKGSLTPKDLPELLEFINPIIEGKALYLEYDE